VISRAAADVVDVVDAVDAVPRVRAVNVGVAAFGDVARAAGAEVAQLDWKPPAGGDRELGITLARLADRSWDPAGARIAAANAVAVERILGAHPRLVDVRPASSAISSLNDRMILHAGPPIGWTDMCGPMRGAVIGAILFEEWADSPSAAEALIAARGVEFGPCHAHGAVGPMAGVISPSMPVFVVENATHGNVAFSNLNEGLGAVLRFGAYGAEVLDRLRWMAGRLGPALAAAVRAMGGIDLNPITAQALQMGDECHNRNVAATSLLARQLAPALVRHVEASIAAEVLDFIAGNNHFYLNLSMAASKVALDAAHDIPDSTVVTAMARNGVEFGIRLSGTGGRWFTAPATVPEGLYFPGRGPADANPDLGDSAITETRGLGGFAMASAPAIVRFVGGTPADALGYSIQMGRITLAQTADFAMPSLDFAGVPTAIDARLVATLGIAPVINTGIAHREPGIGQIGAGIARAPLECFYAAIRGLADSVGLGEWPPTTIDPFSD
jgi:hypothetical protein